jgi:hypothetical protein
MDREVAGDAGPVWIVERRHRLRRLREEEELLPPP